MIPVSYSYRSLMVRWKTTLMTATGFTLVVAALIVMLAFINGLAEVCAQ
jgi:ABC-type lipoprotein release transport system permease subunit